MKCTPRRSQVPGGTVERTTKKAVLSSCRSAATTSSTMVRCTSPVAASIGVGTEMSTTSQRATSSSVVPSGSQAAGSLS